MTGGSLEIVDRNGDGMLISRVNHKNVDAAFLLRVRDEDEPAGIYLTADDARKLRDWLSRHLEILRLAGERG